MSDRARKAPVAQKTSDVTRPRIVALATLGAVAGVAVVVLADGTPMSTPRPIPRPHAKVACATCHGEPASAEVLASSCKTCHGPTGHGSTRAAHRNLAAKGELKCATCHGQHSGAQGVTFAPSGIVRWGAGPLGSSGVSVPPPRLSGVAPGAVASGTTVPLVPLAVCAKCHDPFRSGDPIAACVPAPVRGADPADGGVALLKKTPSQCFDEHVALGPPESRGHSVCEGQHGPNRFVAWDAAREIAATTPWVSPAKKEGVPWMPVGGALATALVIAGTGSLLQRRKRGGESAAKALPVAPAARKRLPTINPATCLGCYACVDACPFDVLTIEKYVAVVARPDECCGVVLCEQVCPNGSLKVADGEPILDRPATDEDLESKDVPGIFLAGDLTGLPLIKNAINQGARAIDRVATTLPKRRLSTDVIVIGGGPAGLSAALRAKEKGLACIVLEQATVAASIKSFPRDKIVHDPPLDLPVVGELWLKEATKEELLAQWTRIVRARAIDVREGHRVIDVTKEGEGFVVTVEQERGEERLRASRVVLAIGRRGTPRAIEGLEIEPGTEERIAYTLADARSFEGKRVVIVGLGDSAMEAALALARQPGTAVTISYRGKTFARGKAKNIAEVESLVAKSRLKLLFETVPITITKTGVTLKNTGSRGGRVHVGADAMIVLIGGIPSWDLLQRAGIHRPTS